MDLRPTEDHFYQLIVKGAMIQNKLVSNIQKKIDAKKAAQGKEGKQIFQKVFMPWKVIGSKKRRAAAKATVAAAAKTAADTAAKEKDYADTKAALIQAQASQQKPFSWWDIFK